MFTTSIDGAQGMSLADFPAPAGRVVGAAFDDAIETNPVPLFMQSMELNAARSQGYRMSREEASAEAKRQGVDVKVPEDGITLPAFNILAERRRDEAARQLLFSRGTGAAVSAGKFAAGMAGALMDPVNAAAGFVPVLNGTRYAGMLAEAGTVGSRAAIRLGVGAAEGAVGAAAVELPTLSLRRDLQDDYSLYDSLANIAFGTFASSGIRGVSGAARDAWLGIRKARELDAMRAVPPELYEQMRTQSANAEERAFWSDLEQGMQRGEGIPPAMAAAFERERLQPEFTAAMDDYRAERAGIGAAADEAIERRFQREREKMLAAGVEPDEALRAAFRASHPETERALLTAAQVGARRLDELELQAARQALAEGRGRVLVPRDDTQILAAISDETHAQALRAAVAQAIEGRRVDVGSVLRTDPVFGPLRIDLSEARSLSRANMTPEAKVGADRRSSERASLALEKPEVAKAPKAKPPKGGKEPEKSPELIEAEELRADAEEVLNDAIEAWRPLPGEAAKGGAGKARAVDTALVAKALAVDRAKVLKLGVKFEADNAAFTKAIKELLADADRDAKADRNGGAGTGEKAEGGSRPADPEAARAEQYADAFRAIAACAERGGL